MSIRHHLSPKYPLVVTIFEGLFSYEEVLDCFKTLDQYLHDSNNSMMYWIVEALDAEFSQMTAIRVVELIKQETPGTVGDPRMIPLIVMEREKYNFLIQELENRYFWMDYPVFNSIEEAFYFLHSLMDL